MSKRKLYIFCGLADFKRDQGKNAILIEDMPESTEDEQRSKAYAYRNYADTLLKLGRKADAVSRYQAAIGLLIDHTILYDISDLCSFFEKLSAIAVECDEQDKADSKIACDCYSFIIENISKTNLAQRIILDFKYDAIFNRGDYYYSQAVAGDVPSKQQALDDYIASLHLGHNLKARLADQHALIARISETYRLFAAPAEPAAPLAPAQSTKDLGLINDAILQTMEEMPEPRFQDDARRAQDNCLQPSFTLGSPDIERTRAQMAR